MIRDLQPADHDAWGGLWRQYLEFYETVLDPAVTEATFGRLSTGDGMHAALATDAVGDVIGFVHWIVHPSTWSRTGYCYLEDLFVDPAARGAGVGRALISHVTEQARAQGLEKVYWLTHGTNASARRLYDDVAVLSGFVHYELDLGAAPVSD